MSRGRCWSHEFLRVGAALLGVLLSAGLAVSSARALDTGAVWGTDASGDPVVRIPARMAYRLPHRVAPDEDGAPANPAWSDPGETFTWIGELKAVGEAKPTLLIHLPAGEKVKLRLMAFSGGPESGRPPKASFAVAEATGKVGPDPIAVAFPALQIAQPGYTRFTLFGVKRKGKTFGDVVSLALSGSALKDAHFNTTSFRSPASVHLHYPNPEGGAPVDAYYNEVTAVDDPATTYYCAIGWNRGYMGYQINSPTERRIIFSVWDAGKEPKDPNKVATADRAQWLAKGPGVVAERFGNEGTGGHSHLVYHWATGKTYRFLVTAQPDGPSHVIYAGYFYFPEKKAWGLIGRIRTPLGAAAGASDAASDAYSLKGFYSFDEDWSGTYGEMRRLANFGPEWAHTTDGKWHPLLDATFTHTDKENMGRTDFAAYPVDNGRAFALATGGYVAPGTPIKYGDKLHRNNAGSVPPDIAAVLASPPAGQPVDSGAASGGH